MMFRNFLVNALGSEVKVRILTHLFSEGGGVMTSERELAKLLGISHTAVNKAMKDFHDLNLITPMRVGGANVWKLNTESYAFRVLSGELFKSNTPIDDLKQEVAKFLKNHGASEQEIFVYLFGSIAEGTELPNSDLDLLFMVGGNALKNGITNMSPEVAEKIVRLYGNRLSIYVVDTNRIRSGEKKIIEKALKKGIQLIAKGRTVLF